MHENLCFSPSVSICIATIFLYSLCSSLFHYAQFDCIPFYCIVTTFVVSAIVSHQHKLDMVHVQNSTLAGGVAVGSVCNLLVGPHGALLIGTISAIISVLGYRYLSVGSYFKRFVQCTHCSNVPSTQSCVPNVAQ